MPETVIRFKSEDELDRIERAVDGSEFDDLEEFIIEGALRLVGDLLDEDGPIECPHDDCDGTFHTHRQLNGHLGSSAHALEVPEGDFWCGYCGRGPLSWRGLNGHHSASPAHDGDPIRLDEEPTEEDLVGVDLPDHRNPQLLRHLYREHDGNISELCRAHDFDVHQGTVRSWLVKYEIHKVTPHGTSGDNIPEYRDRDRLEDLYEQADGNVSEVHRRLNDEVQEEIPYRTIHNWLKELEIHDPTAGTAARSASTESESSDERASPEDGRDDADEESADIHEEPSTDTDESSEGEIEQPGQADSFGDLVTPDWLDEATFYTAAEMADDIDELAETLGWPEHDRLAAMVESLGLEIGDREKKVATDGGSATLPLWHENESCPGCGSDVDPDVTAVESGLRYCSSTCADEHINGDANPHPCNCCDQLVEVVKA